MGDWHSGPYGFVTLMLAFDQQCFSRETPNDLRKMTSLKRARPLQCKVWIRSFLAHGAFYGFWVTALITFLSQGQHNIYTINHAADMNQLRSRYFVVICWLRCGAFSNQSLHLATTALSAVSLIYYIVAMQWELQTHVSLTPRSTGASNYIVWLIN